MLANEKLDQANYDLCNLKVQLFLNDGDMVELLTTSMAVLVDKDE